MERAERWVAQRCSFRAGEITLIIVSESERDEEEREGKSAME